MSHGVVELATENVILLIEVNVRYAAVLGEWARARQMTVAAGELGSAAVPARECTSICVAQTDGSRESIRAIESLEKFLRDVPFLVLVPNDDVRSALQLARGAAHVVPIPHCPADVAARALWIATEARAQRRGSPAVSRLGLASPASDALATELGRIASLKRPVYLNGEEGSGRAFAAKALHELSSRCGHPFVSLSAPEAVLREGVLRRGTIYIEDVASLDRRGQSHLLELVRNPRIRVISSGTRDLAADVRAGSIRADLLTQLTVHEINLIPLRERSGDIAPLARGELDRAAATLCVPTPSADETFYSRLETGSWRRNLLQLRSVVERVILSTRSDEPLTAQSISGSSIEH
jgi:two-component system nitrogen regulation response regulator NtrX